MHIIEEYRGLEVESSRLEEAADAELRWDLPLLDKERDHLPHFTHSAIKIR